MPARRTPRSRSQAARVFTQAPQSLAAMAAAQVVTSPKNPYFRRAKGKGLTAQDRALRASKAASRALGDLWAAVKKKSRLSRRDRGKLLVLDAATGKRYPELLAVPRQRKVFVVKVDRLGRIRRYNPVDPRTLAKGVAPQRRALRLAEFDWRPLAKAEPKKFREIMTEQAVRGRRLPMGGIDPDELFTARTQRGDLDRVAERMAQLYRRAVTGQADHTQWAFEFNVLVRGLPAALRLQMDPLRSYMFFKLAGTGRDRRLVPVRGRSMALLRRVVGFKLRDLIRRALAERGLVSVASARRVRALAANRGKGRKKWRNVTGAPWAGAGRADAWIERVEFRLRRIL